MKESSKQTDILAGLLGLVVALGMLNWAASIIHLPWTLNFSGAKAALLGESNLSTQSPNPAKDTIPEHNNLFSVWTSLFSKVLLFLIVVWLIIGIVLWYRKSSTHTSKSLSDFLVFRWPQITLGYLLNRPALIQDAWERYTLAQSGLAAQNSSSQFATPTALRQIEQILYAAMKGSDIKVEEEIGLGPDKRTLIRTNLVASWKENGWIIQLTWPRGFQLDIYTKWREWGPNMAPIALRHYGYPTLKAHVDDYGFLHIALDTPTASIPTQEKADDFPKAKEKETIEPENTLHQSSGSKEGPLRDGGPPLSLLTPGKGSVGRPTEGKVVAKALEEALSTFQLPGTVHIRGVGPSLIQLAIIPQRGTSPKMIISRVDDLRMAAKGALPGLTLEGTDTEIRALVSRTNREIVALRDLLAAIPPKNIDEKTIPLLFPIGVDLAGSPIWISLAKTPHLLIAGTTGSGKSVFSQSMLTSLTFRYSPEQLKFILIDAKGTEMAFYEHIPHLFCPVISEAKEAITAIHWTVTEMDTRNKQFKSAECRDFEGYLRKGYNLARIVIFVDELYDLLVGSGNLRRDLEDNLTRIAQKARSAGIHLVAATQKPTVEAIPSLLKGNIPGRMAFQVSSRIESGVILDDIGAERLIGNGDGFFKMPGRPKERIQAPFIDDNSELTAISKWWRNNLRRESKVSQEDNSLKFMAAKLEQKRKEQEPFDQRQPIAAIQEQPTSEIQEMDTDDLPPIFLKCLEGLEDKFSPLSGDDVWRMNHVAQMVVQVCPVGAVIEEKQLALAFTVSDDVAIKAIQQMSAMGFIKNQGGEKVLVQRWRIDHD